jgi:alpha-L-rhamnosidase
MKLVLLVALVVGATVARAASLEAEYLRCEYRTDPLGIDEVQPRLSWRLKSDERGQLQTAYQLLVASSAKLLKQDNGDLWDSGVVREEDTIAIAYRGKPLASGQPCFWKVKVWDRAGKASGWSRPALWTMGLLQAGDWKADWIGFDKPHAIELPAAPFGGAKWIWHAADPASAPKGRRLFVGEFVLPENLILDKADLLIAADNNCKFVINSNQVVSVKGWLPAQAVDIRNRIKPGKNTLRAEVENTEAGPAGLLAKLTATGTDGRTFTCVTDGAWKTTANPGTNWHKRVLDVAAWPAARELGAYGSAPWGQLKAGLVLPPPVYLRTAFTLEKKIARATLYATGLGIFDLYLNGERVTEDFFNPGWTDYTKRVRYRTYDVTDRVQRGANAFGAIVADGWYSGYVGGGHVRDHYGKQPRVRAQLNLEFIDGSTAVVATGPQWKAATGGLLMGDFLMGETCDARLEPRGWSEGSFDDSAWSAVDTGTELQPLVQAHPGPAVQALAEFTAKTITEPKKGVWVLDLGQNFAGVPRLQVKGAPGQKIVLRFAERLNPDGTVYTANLRSAQATDTYICRGQGTEVWQPRFTFHGFQYVEITGLTKPPKKDTVVGVALSSATPVAGTFQCSDAMLNQLHNNIYWTQRMNFIDLPTDCPQRDERLGWTGDAQVYIRTATLNCDVQAFFTKWLVDLCQDGQRADGQFPMVAPVKVAGPDGGPAWADAGIICPWTLYAIYGDTRILEQHYDAMARFIDFCKKRCTPELLPPAKYHCFGDWLSIQADTPKDVIFMAYFANCTRLMAQTAAVLGRRADEGRFRVLLAQLKTAFNKAYVAPDGRIKGDTQTCYVLALVNDLVEGAQAQAAAKYLVENIESRGGHLSTGFIGTKDLMLALAQIGRNDIACRLIHNATFPSWGFSIRHGATSIWERWNGWTPEEGFGDPGMNSFAHYSFGAVYQWMVENLGGIRATEPAYRHILIAPTLDEQLTYAATSVETIRGRISTSWKKDRGHLTLNVTIPPNTTAIVRIPTPTTAHLTESGQPLTKAVGVKYLHTVGDRVVVALDSGSYSFQTQ